MTTENKPMIYQAICNILKDVEAISKERVNQQQGFKFRGIDDVYNEVHRLFAKHGVFSVPCVTSERMEERQTKNGTNLIYRMLTINYTFYAADGSSVVATVIGEGMDSGDKAANKAMSIAHKYALLQVLAIPTVDMAEPDATSPPESKPASQQAEADKAPESKPDAGTFLAKIQAAGTVEQLELLRKPIADGQFTDGQLKTLRAAYNTRKRALSQAGE